MVRHPFEEYRKSSIIKATHSVAMFDTQFRPLFSKTGITVKLESSSVNHALLTNFRTYLIKFHCITNSCLSSIILLNQQNSKVWWSGLNESLANNYRQKLEQNRLINAIKPVYPVYVYSTLFTGLSPKQLFILHSRLIIDNFRL